MKTRERALFRLILCAALLGFSCSSYMYQKANPALIDGKYDSEFPYKASSEQLEQISESIFMVNCIATYKTFTFDEGENVVLGDVNDRLLRGKAASAQYSDNSVRGTATVIMNDGKKIAFLTCAHIVAFPDTIITYRLGANHRPTKNIRSIAVKVKQFNFVSPLPGESSVDVVFTDVDADIAVVGRNLSTQLAVGIPRISYPLGRAKELEWGTFVYVLGYPAGVKMVTKGIVSSPLKDQDGAFYLDAVLSGGSSGGIALAIRDGIPNFELVGIVRIVQARFSYILGPKDTGEEEYDVSSPYNGDVFVRKRTDLEYGITKCISAEVIRSVLQEHRRQMVEQGYDLAGFLAPKEQ